MTFRPGRKGLLQLRWRLMYAEPKWCTIKREACQSAAPKCIVHNNSMQHLLCRTASRLCVSRLLEDYFYFSAATNSCNSLQLSKFWKFRIELGWIGHVSASHQTATRHSSGHVPTKIGCALLLAGFMGQFLFGLLKLPEGKQAGRMSGTMTEVYLWTSASLAVSRFCCLSASLLFLARSAIG